MAKLFAGNFKTLEKKVYQYLAKKFKVFIKRSTLILTGMLLTPNKSQRKIMALSENLAMNTYEKD